jgi:hypothetical protein
VAQHQPERVLVFDNEDLNRRMDGRHLSQPGGTLARRASVSMSEISFFSR